MKFKMKTDEDIGSEMEFDEYSDETPRKMSSKKKSTRAAARQGSWRTRMIFMSPMFTPMMVEEFDTIAGHAMKQTNGATIYVLVIVSCHIIVGAHIHKKLTRINNIVGLIADLKLVRAWWSLSIKPITMSLAYSLDVP